MSIKIKVTTYFFLVIIGFFISVSFAQAATNVYYSVGQNTSDHSSGGNVSIAGGVATFTVAQVATNLGVGDVLTAGGNTYYLASKIDNNHWNVVTNLGATPADLGSTAITSIAHAYASLSLAEAGIPTPLGTSNLVTGDYILNIPCYYDTGADQTAIAISGWTTDATRYIRIYTPTDIEIEVNQSQRHGGKWGDAKYKLEISSNTTAVQIDDAHVRIDGLQIFSQGTGDWNIGISGGGAGGPDVPGEIWISNSIIRGNNSASANCRGVNIRAAAAGDGTSVKIWNNIIYNWNSMGGIISSDAEVDYHYVYNNTMIDNSWGIVNSAGSFYAKNNIIKGSGDTQAYSGTFASGTDYNATDGTDAIGQGSNNRISQTFTFVDEANDDFHLASTDTAAKDAGTNLSADPYLPFSTDIDSQGRTTGAWDIGADEYVASGNFTLSAWVKPATSIATKAIVGKAEELRLVTDGTGHPICQIKSDGTWQTAATSSAAIAVGEWAQVICSYDRVAMRVYVNGAVTGEQALTAAPDDTNSVFEIGHDASASSTYGYYSGLVDQYRFFASALSVDQVKAEYNFGVSMRLGSSGATSGTGAATNAASGEYCVPGDTTSCAAPVGEWNLNEKVSGDAQTLYDTSGNGNNGTSNDGANNTGMNCSVTGKFGSGCEFDGADDYVGVTSSSFLEIENAITISAWIKTSNLSQDDKEIVSKKTLWNSNSGYELEFDGHDNQIALVGSGDDVAFATGLSFDSNWHHIVGVINGGTGAIYFDGVNKTSDSSLTAISGGSTNLSISRRSGGTDYFDGLIDQVRIYNYARTPAQIAWEYNKGKPIAHWKMDENQSGDGDTVHDESGNGNNGTTVDGANNTGMDCTGDGKFGKGCDLDGVDDYVTMSSPATLDNIGASTWSGWIKPDATGNAAGRIMVKGNGNSEWGLYGKRLRLNSGTGLVFEVETGGGNRAALETSTGVIVQGSWNHFTVVWNGDHDPTTGQWYINGKPVSTTIVSNYQAVIDDSSYDFTIGGDPGTYPRWFKGQIDDVRLYKYPLTQKQVEQVYNEGAAIKF